MSKLPDFSLMAQHTSKLHFNGPDSGFRQNATEIGTLSNVYFEK
jgi:hypothetical protein